MKLARHMFHSLKSKGRCFIVRPIRLCSSTNISEVETVPKIKAMETSHSWSYEIGDESIKGIKFSEVTGTYLIMYTCGICETRQNRSFSKSAYHQGVVIVRCEGCDNLHLIADNLKWFDDKPTNIEDFMKIQNKEVLKIIAEGPLKEHLISKMKK